MDFTSPHAEVFGNSHLHVKPIHLLIYLLLLCQLLLTSVNSEANEFETLYEDLLDQNANLERLESSHGRHGFPLVESLHGLARIQLSANRFNDADASIERAIQITRLHHGLYTPEQYPLLMTEIDVQVQRRNWKEAQEKLQHLSWLIGNRYEGSAQERLDMLRWLAATHRFGATADMEQHRAMHIMAATNFTELAVQYAQLTGQVDDLSYAHLLYELARSYHLESRGILNGGSTSYNLRLIDPRARVVDARAVALGKRYRAGMDKLHMLRDMMLRSDVFDAEAVAMVELYMADWQALFNKGNMAVQYERAVANLMAAGIETEMIDHLLSVPALLPRPTLHLSVSEALLASDGGGLNIAPDAAALATGLPEYRLVVLEPQPELSGYGMDGEGAALASHNADDWPALQVSMLLDPQREITVRTSGYHTKSFVTGIDVNHSDVLPMPRRAFNRVIGRIKNLSFRPAFRGGKMVSAMVSLDFLFQDEGEWVGYPAVVAR